MDKIDIYSNRLIFQQRESMRIKIKTIGFRLVNFKYANIRKI